MNRTFLTFYISTISIMGFIAIIIYSAIGNPETYYGNPINFEAIQLNIVNISRDGHISGGSTEKFTLVKETPFVSLSDSFRVDSHDQQIPLGLKDEIDEYYVCNSEIYAGTYILYDGSAEFTITSDQNFEVEVVNSDDNRLADAIGLAIIWLGIAFVIFLIYLYFSIL